MFAKIIKALRNDVVRPAAPENLIYAVGDIHGRRDLLERLLGQIEDDAAGRDAEIIFLGDYIDRGRESRAVVDRLLAFRGHATLSARFLKGNHEATLLDFLDDPQVGASWAQFGGLETLVSYGVSLPALTDGTRWDSIQERFKSLLPADHLDFYTSLELSLERGCYLFVHAGVDPDLALSGQGEAEYLWIRDAFLNDNRKLERIIVHGHTPEDTPVNDGRRIGLDTGAYATHRLTAARLDRGTVRFLST
jgi:serine/threonine protein phosphatase 1